MSFAEYTLHLSDAADDDLHVQLKHDAQARFTVKSGRKTLEDRLIPAGSIGGAITVASVIYNGLSMSGGTSWRDPVTGKPIDRPKVTVRLRPEDVLVGGVECDCRECSRRAA